MNGTYLRTLAAGVAVVGTLLPVAASARAAQPDLVVSDARVVFHAKGSFGGRARITNRGDAHATRTLVTVTLRIDRRTVRVVKEVRALGLPAGTSRQLRIQGKVPRALRGSFQASICADGTRTLRESSERNNCRSLGRVTVGSRLPAPRVPRQLPPPRLAPTPQPQPQPQPPPAPPPAPAPPSSVPTAPFPFTPGTVFHHADRDYWLYVPTTYDASHQTATTLFLWMHGCGGQAEGDTYTISPGGGQSWISLSLGGRDGACWDMGGDGAKVLAALDDVRTHFNIDPRRVVLGGYSSGGDLAYRTAFTNAGRFAGVLAENTAPFRDTGLSQGAALAAASWKFNVVHLAHTEDDVYPIAQVRDETDALRAAGFPVTRIELPGAHYDSRTDGDLQQRLLPYLDAGWLAP
jgi:hypothetical protein